MTSRRSQSRRVVVSSAFRASVREMAGYYKGLRSTYPNAGQQFSVLMQRLTEDILPKLSNRPRMGRLFVAARYGVDAHHSAMAELEGVLAAHPDAEIREWISPPFSLLYVVTGSDLILVSLKHQRQAGYC